MNPSKLLPVVAVAHVAFAADGSDPRRAFDAIPGTPHPAAAANLAWLDMGLVGARLSAHPGAEGVVSAPPLPGRLRLEGGRDPRCVPSRQRRG